ncbi:amino acid adenylation domain-containing protein [Endothiovibrio diazotrophicus]
MSEAERLAAVEFVAEPDLPLSTIQAGILAEQWAQPASTRYNVPVAYAVEGRLDLVALRAALGALVDRHEILRTVYRDEETGPVQAIAEALPDLLRVVPLADASALSEFTAREAAHPFDLHREPPIRAALATVGGRPVALILVFHHIAVDGWSIRLLLDELAAAYNTGSASALPEVELQYADWGAWQLEQLEGVQAQARLERAVERLREVPFDLGLPPRPESAVDGDAAMIPFVLEPALVAGVEERAREAGVSPYALLAAAYALLVARLGDRDRLAIGTPVALRDRAELHGTVGCFVNTVVLALDLDPAQSVDALLAGVREAVVDALEEREIPFERLMRRLAESRGAGEKVARLFFNFDDAGILPPKLDGATLTPIDCDRGTAKFDLMLSMVRTDEGIRAGFDHARGVLPEGLAASLAGRYRAAIEWICANRETLLSAFSLVGEEEAAALRTAGRGEARALPETTLDRWVFEAAAQTPAATAVLAEDGALDFAGLTGRAEALAGQLAAAGVGRGDRVLILLPRGVALPVAMLGVLRVGAAYVPLEVTTPEARLGDLIDDAEPAAILFSAAERVVVERVAEDGIARFQAVAEGRFEHLGGGGVPQARQSPTSDDLAYLIYTSGSTGRPKGVMVPHRGVVNYLNWAVEHYHVAAGNGAPVVTATAFDATVLSFWAPLVAGRPVHLLPEAGAVEALAERLAAGAGYSFVKLTPAHLDLLAELRPIAEQRGGTAALVIGGEALLATTSNPWRRGAPSIRLINEYGPTETVVGCAVFEARDGERGAVPIGRAIDNTRLYVLDAHRNLLPAGAVGELYIGGAGVARGYWRRPELTAERFLPDPFGDDPQARIYRTGDRVRFLADGNLEYLGRLDDQLKVRGYRIEPGEIEAALGHLNGVRSAAVAALEEGGERKLVAFVVGTATPAACREGLARVLPAHLLPDRIVMREQLPLTVNGKVDRARLAAEPLPPVERKAAPAPVDDARLAALVELWRGVLKGAADADTDLFAAGGSSLTAIRLLARIKRDHGVELGFNELTAAPTPRAMAQRLFPPAAEVPAGLAAVLAILRRVLKQPELEADADFFAAGGTSLNAIRAVAALKRELGGEIANDVVHRGHSARGIAELLVPGEEAPVADVGPATRLVEGESPRISPGEAQLWLERRLAAEGGAYIMQAAVRLRLPDPERALTEVFTRLAARHPILRTAYPEGEEGPTIQLDNEGWVAPRVVSGDRGMETTVIETATRDAAHPFALERGESARLSFVTGEAGEGVMILSLHHIVSDGGTLSLLLAELITLLAGGDPGPAPAAEYRAYAGWWARQQEREGEAELAYWRARLAAPPPLLDLPTDRPRGLHHRPRGGSLAFRIEHTAVVAAEAHVRRRGGTLHGLLVTAYALLLHRLSGAEEVVIGIPVSDRPEGFERVAGLFLNTLPLRLKVAGETPGNALFGEVREAMAGLLRHSRTPLARIVEALNPPRVAGRTPLLHTVLDWQEARLAAADLKGTAALAPEAWPLPVATAPFDLSLTLARGRDGAIEGGLIYDRTLLDEATVAAWGRAFVTLLYGLVREAGTPVERLPAVARADLARAWLAGPPPAEERPLSTRLEEALERHRDLPAVESNTETLTYGELFERARAVEWGAGPVAVVGVEATLERVVRALSALLRNRTLALIDPLLPGERRARMEERLVHLPELMSGEGPPAYVQFTSGSTGEPKGVALPRAGLANLIAAIGADLAIGPGARVLQLAAPAFDAWVWEVFTTLGNGGTLVLAERDALAAGAPLAATLAERKVSHLTITPSALAALGAVDLPGLTTLVTAGEALTADLVRRWAPGRRLLNAYGPCEATICTTHGACDVARPEGPDIGTPISGMAALVMDGVGLPAIPGAIGELWVAGVGVGLGYLGAPAEEQARFVADPRGGGGRAYRSGDRVRVGGDGRLRFVGRDDRQVKIRGVRIELDEIEAALAALPEVEQAAAKRVDGEDGAALAVWVSGPAPGSEGALRAGLAARLPATMLPAYITILERLPATATGKVDRGALGDPRPAHGEGDEVPLSANEAAILEVFAEVLGLPGRPGRHRDFFTLGGHSLLAVKLVARLGERLGRPVPLALLFAHPDAAGLSGALEREEGACRLRGLRDGERPAAYLFHPVDGSGRSYGGLAGAWCNGARVVAVEQGRGFASLGEQADAYAQSIAADEPGGVIRLAGWSLGATIAAAVAERLRRDGRDVRLALIDAAAPGRFDDGAADREVAAAAAEIGADEATVARVRENIRIAAEHRFGEVPGGAALIRAADNPRAGEAPDLGWNAVFRALTVEVAAGSHRTILRSAGLAERIERLWETQR